MAISGAQRVELHQAMRGLIGVGPADTLMECLPFDGWDGIARVEHVELAVSRMETQLEIRLGQLRDDLRTEMHRGFSMQNRWMAGHLLTFIVGMVIALSR